MRSIKGTGSQENKPKLMRSIIKKKLIASEVRYRRLFESVKDGILILDAETGKNVNPFLIDLLGYTKQDLIEKSIWELGMFHDIYEHKEKFLELQQKEYVRYDDLPLVTSDGHEIHVEFVSNVYLCNNIRVIQCTIRDITERTTIQNEIIFQAGLINNVGQAVITTDLQGKITYWNNSAEKIYGWSTSEAIGKNIIDLTPAQQTNEQAIEIMQKLSVGETWTGEFLVKRKDGISFPVFVTDTPILDSNGKLTGIIGISSDITERKLAEIELIEAKEKAEENDRLKSAFLANMSHEIRTPMNGILGFTGLLKNLNLNDDELKEYITIIEESGIRLLHLLNDIISISKIDAHQVGITIYDTNISDQVDYIYHFFKAEAEHKNLHFSINKGLSKEDSIIKTDCEKVYTVLSNLVSNAIKFTKNGSIELGYLKKDGFFEFYINDNGPGIPDEKKEIIFERFRQGSEELNRAYEGVGLGLSISKAYVEMLGGRIWVEDNAGKIDSGARFVFTIPVTPENEIKPFIQIASHNDPIANQ